MTDLDAHLAAASGHPRESRPLEHPLDRILTAGMMADARIESTGRLPAGPDGERRKLPETWDRSAPSEEVVLAPLF
jgi:hypothetical protein